MIAEQHPTLRALLAAYLNRTVGEEGEDERIEEFVRTNDAAVVADALADLDAVLARADLPTDEVERLANHRLTDAAATRSWLEGIRAAIEAHRGT